MASRKEQPSLEGYYSPPELSELIIEALRALRKAERSPDYRVNMNQWIDYEGRDGDKPLCVVCLAGAYLAHSVFATLDPPPEISYIGSGLHAWHYGGELNTALPPAIEGAANALEYVRCGWVRWALKELGREIPEPWPFTFPPARKVAVYSFNPDKFYRDMEVIAQQLRSVGL